MNEPVKLYVGVPVSAAEAQERLPAAGEARHQSRRPMGESSAARDSEGGRPAIQRRYAPNTQE